MLNHQTIKFSTATQHCEIRTNWKDTHHGRKTYNINSISLHSHFLKGNQSCPSFWSFPESLNQRIPWPNVSFRHVLKQVNRFRRYARSTHAQKSCMLLVAITSLSSQASNNSRATLIQLHLEYTSRNDVIRLSCRCETDCLLRLQKFLRELEQMLREETVVLKPFFQTSWNNAIAWLFCPWCIRLVIALAFDKVVRVTLPKVILGIECSRLEPSLGNLHRIHLKL